MNIPENDIEKFIKKIPYYENPQNYCLGKSMQDAGVVVGKIVKDMEKRNVELDK